MNQNISHERINNGKAESLADGIPESLHILVSNDEAR